MPYIEYLNLESGKRLEHLYMHGEEVPKTIERDGELFKKVPSVPTIRFVGPMSGATNPNYIAKKDDGKIIEPGMERDAERRRYEIKKKNEAEADKYIGEAVKEMEW